MQFTKSERQLHQDSQFTPPCNHYDPHPPKLAITTGSLAGPSFLKEQPHFGLESRFAGIAKEGPGPGTYSHFKNDIGVSVGVGVSQKLRETHRQSFLRDKDNHNPSIPDSQKQRDDEDEKYAEELMKQ